MENALAERCGDHKECSHEPVVVEKIEYIDDGGKVVQDGKLEITVGDNGGGEGMPENGH
jgi:hypothetical protein